MNVRILELSSGDLVNAIIRKGTAVEMPSIHDGWRFNFNKHIKAANTTAYVLVTEAAPDTIEGCLLFQMKNKEVPYMAYVEIAPHNKGNDRIYDYVAGCLIAFAYQQSLIHGQNDYKGMLFFDVLEEKKEDQLKLMALYSKKYGAKRYDGTTMVIIDDDGDNLIQEYLERI
jgi:hypothetical protein